MINKRLSNIDGITSEKFSNLGSRFEYVLNWKLIKEMLVVVPGRKQDANPD